MIERLFGEVGHDMSQEAIAALFPLLEAYEAHVALLAQDEDEIVGVVTLVESVSLYAGGRIGVINELYVEPAYRSEGVGKMLLDAAANFARANGWRRLEVTTPGEEYLRTRRFYEREGFMEIGPRYKLTLE
jgi:GNAT superfamily N-acetyltransferase